MPRKAKKTKKKIDNNKPKGELTIRTLAMPSDTNPHGDIFGGWVLSQMDIAGRDFYKKIYWSKNGNCCSGRDGILLPVLVGDVLCCYCEIEKLGRTSITVKVQVWVSRQFEHDRIKVTEGTFTYVAIDATRRPMVIRRGRELI